MQGPKEMEILKIKLNPWALLGFKVGTLITALRPSQHKADCWTCYVAKEKQGISTCRTLKAPSSIEIFQAVMISQFPGYKMDLQAKN